MQYLYLLWRRLGGLSFYVLVSPPPHLTLDAPLLALTLTYTLPPFLPIVTFILRELISALCCCFLIFSSPPRQTRIPPPSLSPPIPFFSHSFPLLCTPVKSPLSYPKVVSILVLRFSEFLLDFSILLCKRFADPPTGLTTLA